METPLDVLSRAASIVDVRDTMKTGMKRSMEPLETRPYEQIPSKFYKYQRLMGRQAEATHQIYTSGNPDLSKTSRKCAGTQTAMTSLHDRQRESQPVNGHSQENMDRNHSRRDNRASPKHLLDLDQHNKLNHFTPSYASQVPARFINGMDSLPDQEANDADSMPLNLSVSASTGVSSAVAPRESGGHNNYRLRPSVILPIPRDRDGASAYDGINNSPVVSLPPPYQPRKTSDSSNGLCDSVIEEHFQRSLGKHYSSTTSRPVAPSVATSCQQEPPPPKLVVVSTPATSAAGSVDDHFAKSLGETWTKIKEQKDPSNMDGMWSVDDHFAKALGDQWYQIKRAKENRSADVSNGRGPGV